MDTQELHIKNDGSSGHESYKVHLCHKCGWPFPNAHPSAKHRRAHKKVCGTIEGYKLIDSPVLDDEHASDEEHRTPSPKIEKRSVKEIGSTNGNGEKSNKSEDEVFSDAVTEFSDSGFSPGMEDRVSELNKDMDKLVKTDSTESQLLKVDTTADTSKASNDPTHSIQTYNSEVNERMKDQSETAKSSNETRPENYSVEPSGLLALQSGASRVKFKTPDVLIKDIDADVETGTEWDADRDGNKGVDIDKVLTDSLDPHVESARESSKCESNLKETGKQTSYGLTQESLISVVGPERESELEATKGKSSDFATLDTLIDEPVTRDYKFQTGDGQASDLLSSGGIVEQKNDRSDELKASEARNDASPLVKPLDNMEDSASDVGGNIDGTGQNMIDGFYDQRQEGQEDMHVSNLKKEQEETRLSDLEQKEEDTALYSASVSNSVPLIHNAEHMIKDSTKDYNIPKSSVSLDRGSVEVIKFVQEDNHANILVDGHSVLHSGDPSGSIGNTSEELNALKYDIGEKGVDKPIELKSYVSGSTEESFIDHRYCNLETLPDAPRTEAQNIETYYIAEGDCESLQKPYSENASIDKSNIKSAVLVEKVKETTNFIEGENAENNETNKSETSVEGIIESRKEGLEGELLESNKIIEDANKHNCSFIHEDNQATGSLKEDQNEDIEAAAVEVSDLARCERTEVHGGDILKNTGAANESLGQTNKYSDLDMVSDKTVDARGNMEQTGSSLHGDAYLSSQGASRGVETCNVADGIESVGSAAEGVEVNHDCSLPASDQTGSRLLKGTSESSLGASQGVVIGNVTELPESVGSAVNYVDKNHDHSLLASGENPEDSVSKEETPLHGDSELLNRNSTTVEVDHSAEALKSPSSCFEPLQDKGDDKLENQDGGVSMSVAASSRADSMEGNWGSVSVASMQSDTAAIADAGGLFSDSQPSEKSLANKSHPVKLDDFVRVSQKGAPSEVLAAPDVLQQKAEGLKAGWSPSLSRAVNESQGRKKNEEIIAKVSNWSTGRQHGPLKSLLGEAKSPPNSQVSTVTQKDDTATKKNPAAAVTTVNAILRSEPPDDQATDKEMEKEWDSPARYPVEIKKEKKKGKPYWVPFVCCSSVHRDL